MAGNAAFCGVGEEARVGKAAAKTRLSSLYSEKYWKSAKNI